MSLQADVRHALRSLRRDRAYTAIALLTLALGIAANTVIFSIVNGVLLRPLAYRDAGGLVAITEVVAELAKTYPRLPVAARHYEYWRQHAASFAEIGIVEPDRFVLTGLGEPEQLKAARVSAGLLPMLGVQPRIGRLFAEREDQAGQDRVALLSESLWRRRFGGDPRAVGRAITLDGIPRTIVGVLPAPFALPRSRPGAIVATPSNADVYVPIALRTDGLDWFGPFNYTVIARLKPGVSAPQAAAELKVHQAAIATFLPEKMTLGADITALQEESTGASRAPLLTLLAAVGVVLLIVCVNLANLAVARGAARQRDVAIRRALGASRAELVRGILVEAMTLGLAGGLLGTALSWAGLRLVLARAPIDLPRVAEIHLDARVILFGLGLSGLTGLLFGALPAWRAAALDPQLVLRDGGRATEGRAGGVIRHTLVALETGLGVVLLVVAGLLIASFLNLLRVEKGFDTDRVLTTQLTLPRRLLSQPASHEQYLRTVAERLKTVPGVLSAGVISTLPLQGEDWVDLVQREGEHRPSVELPPVNIRFCSPGYFEAAGVQFLRGAAFSERDRQRRLAVISDTTARLLWPGENPVGRRFGRYSAEALFEVAGVVHDVRVGLDRRPVPTIYLPYWGTDSRQAMSVVMRTSADPRAVARSIRQAVWNVDPDTVIGEIRTMDSLVSESVAGRRFQVVLTAAFAGSALLLACLGIYGVVSWSVSRRRNEIGVRMALGAQSADVQRMIVAQGMRPVFAGLAAGVVGALAVGRLLGSLVFGVSPSDPLTYSAVAATLTLVAAVACYLPARRATRADPIRALRYE